MIAKLAVLTVALACGSERQDKIPLAQSPSPTASRSALDSANLAFRAKRYDDALAAYRRAAAGAPDEAAPWYGIFMVATALRQPALADSALAEVKKRSSEPGLLSDGTVRAHADTSARRAHPAVTRPRASGS